jgi:phospholipase/carboxylesterase
MFQLGHNDPSRGLHFRHLYSISEPEAPLIFLLHGKGGTPEAMRTFTRTCPRVSNFILPEGPVAAEGGGLGWWLGSPFDRAQPDWMDGAGKSAELLIEFFQASLEYYKLRPSRLIAMGFSQGAATLSLLVQREAEFLSGAVLLSGFVLPCRAIRADNPATKVAICHGRLDPVVPVALAQEGRRSLEAQGFEVAYFEDDATHKVGTANMRELSAWVKWVLE